MCRASLPCREPHLAKMFSETPPAYGKQNSRILTLTGDGDIQVDRGSAVAPPSPAALLVSIESASAAIIRTEAV